MRFEVPQFVDVEDKIFGPFTWKQFVYLAGGTGAAFIIFITLPFIIFVLVGGPLIAFSLALAFYRVNNRPLSFMIEAVFTFFTSGKKYRWRKDQVKEATVSAAKEVPDFSVRSHNNLSSMSRALEVKAMHGEKRN